MAMDKQNIINLIKSIDLTSLSSLDNQASIKSLVDKANLGHENAHAAAVCVFSNHGDFVRHQLRAEIKTAVVAGYFPSGQASIEAKIEELKFIADSGADEVDIVINRGELIAGNFDFTAKEIELSKSVIGDKKLKVILETGELTAEQISKSSQIAINNGADFIKTSTGKITIGATAEAATIMCSEIKRSGKKVGFKASGGIRTFDDAMIYYRIVEKTLGKEHLVPALFRIGASSLYDSLIKDYNEI